MNFQTCEDIKYISGFPFPLVRYKYTLYLQDTTCLNQLDIKYLICTLQTQTTNHSDIRAMDYC